MNDPYNGIKNAINQYNEYIDYLKKQIEQLQEENEELKRKLNIKEEQKIKIKK